MVLQGAKGQTSIQPSATACCDAGLPHSTTALPHSLPTRGSAEDGRAVQGKRGQTSSQPSATACAQACFNAGSPFYYCPTEPFDNLAAGGSGENCPPDYCDAWTFCGQSGAPRPLSSGRAGSSRLDVPYLQHQAALPDAQDSKRQDCVRAALCGVAMQQGACRRL